MRVLVLWADANNNANLGVRALAQGMESLARQAWGDSIEVELQDFGAGASGVSFGKSAILQEWVSRRGAVRDRLAGFDIVLDSGAGDSFTDAYGLRRLAQMTTVQAAARSLNIPIVMGPQTIGPLRTRAGRLIAKRSIRGMTSVLARDSASAQEARSLGRPVDYAATDVVFALPVVPVEKSRDIVLNVSGLVWQENSHIDAHRYRQSIRAVINELITCGRRVTVMTHVIGPDRPFGGPETKDNDTPAARVLEREFGSRDAFEVAFPSDLAEARAILGGAELVIGTRMHACLNALSMGTPAIPLAYSRKFRPLLEDLDWPWTIDLRATPDFGDDLVSLAESTSTIDVAARVQRTRGLAAERLDHAATVLRQVVG